MAIFMKIKYLDKLKEGYRFKRRFPKDVVQVTGKEFFQARFAVKEEPHPIPKPPHRTY